MTAPAFPHLFSPLTVGRIEIRNRIFSTGHDTSLADGSAGLIIVQSRACTRPRATPVADSNKPSG